MMYIVSTCILLINICIHEIKHALTARQMHCSIDKKCFVYDFNKRFVRFFAIYVRVMFDIY